MRLLALLAGAFLAPAAPAEFGSSVSPVRWADLRFSYRAGCPVPPAELRLVRVSHWAFDGRRHLGAVVVNRRVAGDVVTVFRRLYAARFPIRRMRVRPGMAIEGRVLVRAFESVGWGWGGRWRTPDYQHSRSRGVRTGAACGT